MKKRIFVTGLVWCLVALPLMAGDNAEAIKAIDGVLDMLHQAASDADGEVYFELFADGAIFMGTDATERWSITEFRAYAEHHFSEGRGWTYTKTERNVFVDEDGSTAWFDEMLWNEKYGTCRGTGALIHVDGKWKISQYNLTIPMPNDLAAEFTDRIKEFEDHGTAEK